MKTYEIYKAETDHPFLGAPRGEISCYPWDETGYRPKASFRMLRGVNCFLLQYEAVERELRTENRDISPTVCQDSAVELFLMPAPQADGRYVNLEFNAVGAMYIGVGTCRADNVLLREENLFQFETRTQISHVEAGYHWILETKVPFEFLRRHTGFTTAEKGHEMRGNFYKISEGAQVPYFGAWNDIVWEKPDFHRPEFFGSLICR